MPKSFTSTICLAALLSLTCANAFAADVLAKESPNQWRVSKLSGVMIYGPDNRTVGKVSDVLMSKEGKAEYVIIGVGGFLGIDQKDVAIPYDNVKFTDQPLTPPTNPAPAAGNTVAGTANTMTGSSAAGIQANTKDGMASNSVATNGALGMGATGVNAAGGDMAMPMERSTTYPDHGTIDMTAAQLKDAPTFHYAS